MGQSGQFVPVPNYMERYGHEQLRYCSYFPAPQIQMTGWFLNQFAFFKKYFLRYGGAKVTFYVYFYEVYYRLMQTQQQSGKIGSLLNEALTSHSQS